jgi:hypothetical protein
MGTSILINLGDHGAELSANGLLIASHPTNKAAIETVQLSEEEAYWLYTALHARFQAREALLSYKAAWRAYCVLDAVQHPWTDRMHCIGCGTEQLVAHLNDSGLCATCCRA